MSCVAMCAVAAAQLLVCQTQPGCLVLLENLQALLIAANMVFVIVV
jgi:hypothetical protein